jgi:DNA-binding response OmpR family regulator
MTLYNILIVDGDLNNLNAMKRTLRDGYNVFLANKGRDALSILTNTKVSMVIVDFDLPDIGGLDFLKGVSQEYPEILRIILTDDENNEASIMDALESEYIHAYIIKPWEPEELREIIRGSLYNVSRSHKTGKMIGELLVEHDIISEEQLNAALEIQKQQSAHKRRKLGEILIDLGYAKEESILYCYALQLGMPYVSLSQFSIKPELTELLSPELAYKYNIVPIDKSGRILSVAVSEPLGDDAKKEVEEKTGYRVMTMCSSYRDIGLTLEKCYPGN